MVLGRDVYQAIVQVLGKEAGELFVKAVEKALTELEEEIKNQKHTLKAQLKDELMVDIEAIKDRLFILEKRFDRLELYMRVLLVLVLLGLTLLNPTFFEILKTIFGLK